MNKKTVLSGVQPTGDLHLGNYLGAIKNFAKMQNENDCLFCVVDLHAITIFQDPLELRNNTYEITAAYLACGIDPKKSIIFNQSQVPGHAELAWILNCICRVGWLNRMTQFKEKSGKNSENMSSGLFTYPTLMAADILLYKATHVPVGSDQKQHLELTRDIAQKFNNDYKSENFFPLPEPYIEKDISRVMSLRDGNSKMSKSDPSDYSRINLKDDQDTIVKKIKKSKTADSTIPISEDQINKIPEVSNLFNIFVGVTGLTKSELLSKYAGQNFSNFKSDLSDALIEKVCPIGNEVTKLMQDKKYLKQIMYEGAMKAREKSAIVLEDVYDIIGFVKP
ncbi:MAG: tryptophan--tRNA ligase [Candidatus Pelagibacterales bacterium]|tara:strand:- start:1078 stop:2085 length:1008 start_codon:yes stop_codon:yes gene_type:complete